jgi:hypothetical protein
MGLTALGRGRCRFWVSHPGRHSFPDRATYPVPQATSTLLFDPRTKSPRILPIRHNRSVFSREMSGITSLPAGLMQRTGGRAARGTGAGASVAGTTATPVARTSRACPWHPRRVTRSGPSHPQRTTHERCGCGRRVRVETFGSLRPPPFRCAQGWGTLRMRTTSSGGDLRESPSPTLPLRSRVGHPAQGWGTLLKGGAPWWGTLRMRSAALHPHERASPATRRRDSRTSPSRTPIVSPCPLRSRDKPMFFHPIRSDRPPE